MRHLLKALAVGAATVAVLPRILIFHLSAAIIGRDRALEGATQALAHAPGLRGQYLRRAFLPHAGVLCHPTATICFGTVFSKVGAEIGANVYVGPRCYLGLVHLERDVLLAEGVRVPSGARIHGTTDISKPIREQPGEVRMVRIREGSWVGTAAVILDDVGRHSIIGAGAVVTRPVPDCVVASGVPARVVRSRIGGNGERRTV